MTEAWQVRSAVQQEFVKKLAHEVRDEANKGDTYDRFVIEFLIVILAHFRFKIDPDRAAATSIQIGSTWLVDQMNRRIKEFSRVEPERLYLLWQLFHELEPSISSWASRDYQRAQIENPDEVFGAPSAMAEVDDPE